MTKFTDVLDAFEFVSSDMYCSNQAVVNKNTGKFLYKSEIAGEDEIKEAGINVNSGEWVKIPHKNDLDLGRSIVFEFIADKLPEKLDYVNKMFRQRGAYSKLKHLLDSCGLLQTWDDFENSREEETLRQWCLDNGIKLEDDPPLKRKQ
ncbi:MAG: hypothetical protein ACYC4Q_00780 [Victivallaceae bacterium]